MLGSYALIKNSIVENTIVADDTFVPQEGYSIISIEGLNISTGDTWDGTKFIAQIIIPVIPMPTDTERITAVEDIVMMLLN